jgi:hypothetical protein
MHVFPHSGLYTGFVKPTLSLENKGGVTLCPCHYIKKYLKAKEELWNFIYFTM